MQSSRLRLDQKETDGRLQLYYSGGDSHLLLKNSEYRRHCCDDADLTKGTAVRKKKATALSAEEKASKDVVDMIQRAVGILEKEMGGGASMMREDVSTHSVAKQPCQDVSSLFRTRLCMRNRNCCVKTAGHHVECIMCIIECNHRVSLSVELRA